MCTMHHWFMKQRWSTTRPALTPGTNRTPMFTTWSNGSEGFESSSRRQSPPLREVLSNLRCRNRERKPKIG